MPSAFVKAHTFIHQTAAYMIDDSLSSFMHNDETWDHRTNLLMETCCDMCVEPHMQPQSSETLVHSVRFACTERNSRLDTTASDFWSGWFEDTFSDIRVLNAHVYTLELNKTNHIPIINGTIRRNS